MSDILSDIQEALRRIEAAKPVVMVRPEDVQVFEGVEGIKLQVSPLVAVGRAYVFQQSLVIPPPAEGESGQHRLP